MCVYVQKWLSELDKGRHKRDALHKVLQIIHKVERKVRLHVCVLHLIPNFFLQKLLLVPNTLWVIMVQQSVHSKAFIPKRFQAFPSVPSVSKRFQAFSPTKRSSWSNKARLVQRWSNKRWSNDGPTKRGWSNKARFWSSWSNKARSPSFPFLPTQAQTSFWQPKSNQVCLISCR